MAFLHGVETIVLQSGNVVITTVKSGVMFLIGTAPKGDRNTPVMVLTPTQAAAFGSPLPGFTIPKALADIFAASGGKASVIVVNVLDDDDNLVAVAAESHVITNGKTKSTHAPIKDFALKNNAGTTTYIKGTDYTVDDYGNVQVLDFTQIAEGATVKLDYKKLDASTVANAQIIGAVDGDGVRTGFKTIDLCYSLFGVKPKIILAPGFSSVNAIKTEMIAQAVAVRGRALIDAPAGTTPAVAIAGRGPAGAINFYTSSSRAVLLYPMVKAYDIATDADEDRPYSQFFAGLWSKVINDEGYWVSPSNREIGGITGVERTITWDISRTDTEANQLNEQGIVTVAAGFGTGIRTWGNRSAAYPSSTDQTNFLAIQLIADVIHESLELGALPFVDQPITPALIDTIRESGNAFVRSLIGRGALIDGSKVVYDPAKNDPSEIAAGHLTFDLVFAGPSPLERLTFESYLDINLLKNVNPS